MNEEKTNISKLNEIYWGDKYQENVMGPGDVRANFPRRDPESHKGQNGKLLIIGGSEQYHGSPLINFLGAQSIGVDLTVLHLPLEHVQTAKNFSPSYFIKPFINNHLAANDVEKILENSEEVDACVIGCGLDNNEETIHSIIEILERISVPCVIDADAILPYSDYNRIPEGSIFTPHKMEAQRLYGDEIPEKLYDITILKKGKIDIITRSGTKKENHTGTAALTRGGTGDLLAGMCGALIARGTPDFEAAGIATFLLGHADELSEKIYGQCYCFTNLTDTISWTTKQILNGDAVRRTVDHD